jgi:hypothetical protein
LLHRWQDEAVRAGRTIRGSRLPWRPGRDGFWLARWLAARGVEAQVIQASSVAVSREHRRVVCVKFSKLVMVGVRWFIEVTQRSIPLFDRK